MKVQRNCSKEVFILVKNPVPWTYVINDLNSEPITGSFYEQELQKTIHKNSEQKRYLKEKVINFILNEKDSFNSWINKKDFVQK